MTAHASTRVWLRSHVLEQMLAESDARAPDEAGGMLLGYQTTAPDTQEFVIADVIGPGPDARHRRHRFEPDGPWQQQQLEERYASSGRVRTYLGDWHTHPNGTVAPSRRDLRCARRIARCRASRAPHPLMLILGDEGDDESGPSCWRPACFRYTEARLVPVEMRLLAAS